MNSWIVKKDIESNSLKFYSIVQKGVNTFLISLEVSEETLTLKLIFPTATETDWKNVTHVDTSRFALKTNLASLKTEFDKLGIDKLAPVPVDLSKLRDVVTNDVVKKLYMIN